MKDETLLYHGSNKLVKTSAGGRISEKFWTVLWRMT